METNKNAYKEILKATSLFGGVQFINILISIVKTKMAALLIGVAGVGIFGILSSTLNFVQALTRCGLDITAIKEIASAKDDNNRFEKINLVNKLALFTGIFGVFVVLIFSPSLSQIAFCNKTYTLFFTIISIAVLFNQLSVANMAVLQGMKSLKRLAKVIMFSSILSLIPIASIYYFFGEKGIPWVITITAFISFMVSRYHVSKLKIKTPSISLKKKVEEGKTILKSGIYLSLASIINMLVGFVIQVFMTNAGGIVEVGYYNAGFLLINSYVAIFFSALSKDFFPRLVEVSNNNVMVSKTVNEQANVLLLLITPLIIIFLIFKEYIVLLLFSNAFLPILGMISYGILATTFKAVSWSMGFILIAKGNNKLYFITEVVSYSALLIAIILGYNINGLTGLGIGFLVYHFFDLVFIKCIVSKKYKFKFDSSFNKIFYLCIFQFVIILCLFSVKNEVFKYSMMAIMVLFSIVLTITKLHRYINLKETFKHYFKIKT